MVSVEQALEIVLGEASPLSAEEIALEEALARVLAENVHADRDLPPFDRAAMDGYAVIAEDTFGAGPSSPKTLRAVDRIYTGQVPSRAIGPGECAEVATGSPLPPGATAVVIVEETEGDGENVRVLTPVYPGQHVGRRGADMAAGQIAIAVGTVLNPARVGAAAATGVTHIDVYARPTVAILSTGNEIAEPGEPLAPGQIYDINRFTLEAIVGRHGGIGVPLPAAGDTLHELNDAIDAAVAHDIVVFSGGSSVGERDLILDVLRARGRVHFHGIAVKPGKPTAFGVIDGKPFFGMPGNPTSCLSNGYMLLAPFLRRVARLPEWEPTIVEAPLSRRIVSTTGRHQFYTVRLVEGRAEPAFKGSGDITSMAHADGYIEIPAQTDVVEAGTMVRVKLF